MRRIFAALGLAALIVFGGPDGVFAPPATAQTVSLDVFFGRLSPHGRWFEHRRYGWVWRPGVAGRGWRPYTHGRWAWTVEYGWMWVSDYRWGSIPFHYGRWFNDREFGWFWVPDTVWGPAWVAWRTGGGYIGWYPLPPEVRWSIGFGLAYGTYFYGPAYDYYWTYVPTRYFVSRRIHRWTVRPRQNAFIGRRTRRSTRYTRVGNRIVNRSISRDTVRRATGRNVPRSRVNVLRRGPGPRRTAPRPGARRIPVYRPRLRDARPRRQPPPVRSRIQPRLRPRYQPPTGWRVRPRAQPRYQPPTRSRVQPRVRPRVRPRAQPRYQPRVQPRYRPRYRPPARPRVQPRAHPRWRPPPPSRRRATPPPRRSRAAPSRQRRGQPSGGGGPRRRRLR